MAAGKALEAWRELNDRQQGTLAVVFELDQGAETSRRRSAARGEWDDRPASEWRTIDFAHEPGDRRAFGWTLMQERLASRGWDNQGNGSTVAALAARGLLERDARPTTFGFMHQVRLTRAGRAAARAGTADTPGGPRKASLGERSWEVLAMLWRADTRGGILPWGHSPTIENVLIKKHVPPLAESVSPGSGYRITDRGKDFYRQQYAAHAAAHPNVTAPHPDGARAEPWPAEADTRLARLARTRRALAAAWKEARDQHQAAQAEAQPPAATGLAAQERERYLRALPDEAARLRADRALLWQDTARQRAEQAAADTARLEELLTEAARAWAAAALRGFNAAVGGVDPLAVLPAADDPAEWADPRLVPPAQTGVHGLDDDAVRLYAAAVGTPRKRRGPAPKERRAWARTLAREVPEPGAPYAELAWWLTDQLAGGSLVRRLHPHRLAAEAAVQSTETKEHQPQ
ncbi:hypothetical protein GCM10010363_61020 [Streptomyces omiyaensis]|uniref:hypothetical protein n=1 Tax=Streptomyces omiyaensis TaxID=68247 RepID=UPI00167508DB|nr:hypothetical protein [Streptomyces omiyaensis]GGY71470.1 hypothetical protein GCM10010363_61020 [Streptomyces omiyaensis]